MTFYSDNQDKASRQDGEAEQGVSSPCMQELCLATHLRF